MDNADLIEQYEDELWHTIYKMHRDGICYEAAYDTLQRITKSLDIMCYSEAYLGQYAPESVKKAP